MQDIELLITGLILVAVSETRFDLFVRVWDADVTHIWEHEAHAQQWTFQQHGWGDFNHYEDDLLQETS